MRSLESNQETTINKMTLITEKMENKKKKLKTKRMSEVKIYYIRSYYCC